MLEYRIERKLTWQKDAQWSFFEMTSEETYPKRLAYLRKKMPESSGIKYRTVCGHFVIRTELE